MLVLSSLSRLPKSNKRFVCLFVCLLKLRASIKLLSPRDAALFHGASNSSMHHNECVALCKDTRHQPERPILRRCILIHRKFNSMQCTFIQSKTTRRPLTSHIKIHDIINTHKHIASFWKTMSSELPAVYR